MVVGSSSVVVERGIGGVEVKGIGGVEVRGIVDVVGTVVVRLVAMLLVQGFATVVVGVIQVAFVAGMIVHLVVFPGIPEVVRWFAVGLGLLAGLYSNLLRFGLLSYFLGVQCRRKRRRSLRNRVDKILE